MLLLATQAMPLKAVAESIVLKWTIADEVEQRDQVRYLPRLIRHVFHR